MRGMAFFTLLLASFLAAAQAPPPATEEAMDASAPPVSPPALEEWWNTPGPCESEGRLELSVDVASSCIAGPPITFDCHLLVRRGGGQVPVLLTVSDSSGNALGHDEIVLSVAEGPNTCIFHWDASSAVPGEYVAVIEAVPPGDDAPSRCVVHLKRMSEVRLRAEMDRLQGRLETLGQSLDEAIAQGMDYSPLDKRIRVAQEFVRRARDDAQAGRWREVSRKLEYANRTEKGVYGIFVLGKPADRIVVSPSSAATSLVVEKGGFFRGAQPVFLFGVALSTPDPLAVQALARFGMNLAVFALPKALDPASSTSLTNEFFDAARENGVNLFAQIMPRPEGETPEARADAFMRFIQSPEAAALDERLKDSLPTLAAEQAVVGLSLALEPRFKFQDESTRQRFIEYVQALYEDRHAMNQSWRSHMGDYQEIQIAGDNALHDYREKRAYQWDWQQFHQTLAMDYFRGLRDLILASAVNKPLLVTLPDTVFDKGESRDGLDREGLANLMDISGCTAALFPKSDLYAYSYPQQSAFCTLMRSMQPDKPVLCLENRIVLDPAMAPDAVSGYVRSAIWDAVISGLSGMALPADSEILDYPEAMDAYVTAALDINRLAPVVYALQCAPAEVGVLWSDSSKALDDGDPYLNSARFAYEGLSFSGYQVRYVTENQCLQGALDRLKVLVIPETPAVRDQTFAAIQKYVENGGTVAKVGKPIPYNERGQSRHDVIRNTGKTVLVRGMNLPTEYLHAMDAAIELGSLHAIPRPINASGYPLEGVKTRYVEYGGQHYLFVLNLRNERVLCHLAGPQQSGIDLVLGREVRFPKELPPLDPMLIRLDSAVPESTLRTP